MPSSSFSLPFFPPPDGARSKERTNERTNERALITGWRGTRSITHFFCRGCGRAGLFPPSPPHTLFCNLRCMYVMRGGLRQRAEPPAHGCAQYICKNRQRKLGLFLFFLLPKCVFPLLLPFGQWRQKKRTGGGKGSLFEKRRRRGGKHGQSNKEEEEEGET